MSENVKIKVIHKFRPGTVLEILTPEIAGGKNWEVRPVPVLFIATKPAVIFGHTLELGRQSNRRTTVLNKVGVILDDIDRSQ